MFVQYFASSRRLTEALHLVNLSQPGHPADCESTSSFHPPAYLSSAGLVFVEFLYPLSCSVVMVSIVHVSFLRCSPSATQLFKLLNKYKPETKLQKKDRLKQEAKKRLEGEESTTKKPLFVKCGINHVTHLVEDKKAQLVVIAHDVDPIEVRTYVRICISPAVNMIT